MWPQKRWISVPGMFVVLTVLTVGLTGVAWQVGAQGPMVMRLSVADDGTQGNLISGGVAISANGCYVVFHSAATTLIRGDTNASTDVFVRDCTTGQVERRSVASDGAQGNGDSYRSAISDNGRFVAFQSYATNLISNDTNQSRDVFVHDRQWHTTTRISVSSTGAQAVTDSGDPAISGDGRYIAFSSWAPNLVPQDTNGGPDVFVHDRQTSATWRVSVASGGTQGNGTSHDPAISADGRYVVFQSDASNLVTGDTNGLPDIFLHDLQTSATVLISMGMNGTQTNGDSYSPSISANGRYVGFTSDASNVVPHDHNDVLDAFVYDRETEETLVVSVAFDGSQTGGSSSFPVVSDDGRYAAFVSIASDLVPGDNNGVADVFRYDRHLHETTLVSMASDGVLGNAGSYAPDISGDGRYISFESLADTLVPGDTNEVGDVFLHAMDGVFPMPPTPLPTAVPSLTPVLTATSTPTATHTPATTPSLTSTPIPTHTQTPSPVAVTSTPIVTPPGTATPRSTPTRTTIPTPSPSDTPSPMPQTTGTSPVTPSPMSRKGDVFLPLVLR
jgi:Tol biopolymer transport system component